MWLYVCSCCVLMTLGEAKVKLTYNDIANAVREHADDYAWKPQQGTGWSETVRVEGGKVPALEYPPRSVPVQVKVEGTQPAGETGGAATASGTGGDATASGKGGDTTASGTGGDATASGKGGDTTASGTGGDATASGTEGDPTASGTGGDTTAEGGDATASPDARYQPTWSSLDSRPLPGWYDQAKLGIFIHWGVFSVPSFNGAWFWFRLAAGVPEYVDFMRRNYPPGWTYQDFAAQFTAEFYDPAQWADIFQASGARYVVMVSKHHEGFTLWPSSVAWNWNAMDVGPKRDLVGELVAAVRANTSLHMGLYHSLFEWFNPLFRGDKANNFTTDKFVKEKTIPELYELVNRYKPDVLWSDGQGAADSSYWTTKEFLAWLYNDSPVKDKVVTNDRWGKETVCKHGGFYTCGDRHNPGVLQKHKWENCMTIDKNTWGYNRNSQLEAYLSIEELITTLVETVSCGGNLLVNVGPTHDGRILPIFEERLRQLGSWMKVNGDAIYGSSPWHHQNDTATSGVWYTSKKDGGETVVFATVLHYPPDGVLKLGSPTSTSNTRVTMLGYPDPFPWTPGKGGGVVVTFPGIPYSRLPCQWAWVLKIQHVQ